jgi:hypothetical protein
MIGRRRWPRPISKSGTGTTRCWGGPPVCSPSTTSPTRASTTPLATRLSGLAVAAISRRTSSRTTGAISFLKGGIAYADMVNTVSPTYANETRTPAVGLWHGPLSQRQGRPTTWASSTAWITPVEPGDATALIPAAYSADDLWRQGAVQAAIAAAHLLEESPDTPIDRRGQPLCRPKGAGPAGWGNRGHCADMRVQFVILGSGDKGSGGLLWGLPMRYPGRVGSLHRLQQRACPLDRGRQRLLHHAVDLRAVRAEPDLFAEVWHVADCARHWRAGRHGAAVRRGQRRGHRLQVLVDQRRARSTTPSAGR